MNITKMSLAAALLIGSSAMALDNTKVGGDANLYYQTSDASNGDFFESGSSAADMSLNFNVTTDLMKTDSVAVSAGVGYTVLTTLGTEGTLADNGWGGAHQVTGNDANGTKNVDSARWTTEAWIAATAGKTTAKLGRMELDTPLAFTEKWTIEKNTFEGAVVLNQDIPNTTLVGAYIGRGNGSVSAANSGSGSATPQTGNPSAAVVSDNGLFRNYGTQGAYAVGALNNSWKPLAVQAWFYDITSLGQATWFQGDLDLATLGAKGLTLGLQHTTLSVNDAAATAGMVGYATKAVSAKLSYSTVSKSGGAGYNTATATSTAQSKLYTEAWWNYGQVVMAGAQTVNLTVEAPTKVADLGLYITMIDHEAAATATTGDITEVTASASKSFGAVDASLVYILTDTKTEASSSTTRNDSNTVQVYLTANF